VLLLHAMLLLLASFWPMPVLLELLLHAMLLLLLAAPPLPPHVWLVGPSLLLLVEGLLLKVSPLLAVLLVGVVLTRNRTTFCTSDRIPAASPPTDSPSLCLVAAGRDASPGRQFSIVATCASTALSPPATVTSK